MLPAITGEPTPFATGRLSPVITASSVWDSPSMTTPSTGMRSPGRTRTSMPASTSRTGRRISAPIVHHDDAFAFRRQQRLEIARRPGAAGRLEISGRA